MQAINQQESDWPLRPGNVLKPADDGTHHIVQACVLDDTGEAVESGFTRPHRLPYRADKSLVWVDRVDC